MSKTATNTVFRERASHDGLASAPSNAATTRTELSTPRASRSSNGSFRSAGAGVLGRPAERFEMDESLTTAAGRRVNGEPPASLEQPLANPQATDARGNGEGEIDMTVYPTGTKLWLSLAAVLLVALAKGLDTTVVAVIVPSLTNEFKSVRDIGWYSAAANLSMSATTFLWGRLYTLRPNSLKPFFLAALLIFASSSLFAALAPSSATFIAARALTGLASAGIANGAITVLSRMFPLQKRPFWLGIVGGVQSIALVAAPLVGGAFVDSKWGWRGAFGVNVPLGLLGAGGIWWGFEDPVARSARGRGANSASEDGVLQMQSHPATEQAAVHDTLPRLDSTDTALPTPIPRPSNSSAGNETRSWLTIILALDLPSTLTTICSITSLLLALQFAPTHSFHSALVLSLLIVSPILFAVFVFVQHHPLPIQRLFPSTTARDPQPAVTIPPILLHSPAILLACAYQAFSDSLLASTEFLLSIYLQSILLLPATLSGALGSLPIILGIMLFSILAGILTSRYGYYKPWMLLGAIIAAIPTGVMTTLSTETRPGAIKAGICLGLLGVGVGLGINGPFAAVQTTLVQMKMEKHVATANAMLTFSGGVGSAVAVAGGAALFQAELVNELQSRGGTVDQLLRNGLKDIREIVGEERLKVVLLGLDRALTKTLYLPMALALATVAAAAFMKGGSVKQKTQ